MLKKSFGIGRKKRDMCFKDSRETRQIFKSNKLRCNNAGKQLALNG
jgi:hypothetical protein